MRMKWEWKYLFIKWFWYEKKKQPCIYLQVVKLQLFRRGRGRNILWWLKFKAFSLIRTLQFNLLNNTLQHFVNSYSVQSSKYNQYLLSHLDLAILIQSSGDWIGRWAIGRKTMVYQLWVKEMLITQSWRDLFYSLQFWLIFLGSSPILLLTYTDWVAKKVTTPDLNDLGKNFSVLILPRVVLFVVSVKKNLPSELRIIK